MTFKRWKIHSEGEWTDLIPEILDFCHDYRKCKLQGEMGAGKTTFVKYIGNYAGIDEVTSPTFPIVNEYAVPPDFQNRLGQVLYHIDLYRIETEEELLGIGFEEYLDDDNFTFVEWPGISDGYWPERYADFSIKDLGNGVRELLIILHDKE